MTCAEFFLDLYPLQEFTIFSSNKNRRTSVNLTRRGWRHRSNDGNMTTPISSMQSLFASTKQWRTFVAHLLSTQPTKTNKEYTNTRKRLKIKKKIVDQDNANVDNSTYLLIFVWALRGLSPRNIEITLCA